MIEPRLSGSVSSSYETLFDHATKQSQTAAIESKMAEPGFWDHQEAAQATIAELKSLNAILKPLDEAIAATADLQALVEMAQEDESLAGELPSELERLERLIGDLELRGLLNGPYDSKGAILTINARDGGTDANDWAEMMLRMYIHWERKRTTTRSRSSTARTTWWPESRARRW